MIFGVHLLLFSEAPESDRAFLRNALGFRAIDFGGGWLIFKLPPSEAAIHPAPGADEKAHAGRSMLGAVVYLMCDDLRDTIRSLRTKKVRCTAVNKETWGLKTTIRLPSGGEIGLYQPSHPTALKPGRPNTGRRTRSAGRRNAPAAAPRFGATARRGQTL